MSAELIKLLMVLAQDFDGELHPSSGSKIAFHMPLYGCSAFQLIALRKEFFFIF